MNDQLTEYKKYRDAAWVYFRDRGVNGMNNTIPTFIAGAEYGAKDERDRMFEILDRHVPALAKVLKEKLTPAPIAESPEMNEVAETLSKKDSCI